MRLWNFLIAIDQLCNVFIGSGYADETLSAYCHREGGLKMKLINSLFFWQEDHCLDAYIAEFMRTQLPARYRR